MLPFLGFGAWMLYSVGTTLADASAMRGWVPVPATLSDAGFETRAGDESTTYEAFATYHYEYRGRRYSGSRVSVAGGGDNIGEYQRRTGRRLEQARRRNEPITVYVDPAEPSQAVIDRSVRWGLVGFKSIFVVVFGGFACAVLVFLWRHAPNEIPHSPGFESSPWLRNPAWQGGAIESGSKQSMWMAWGFAVFWNAVSAPAPFLVYDEIVSKGNPAALAGLLFPVVGIGLLWWAVRRTLEWRRFGPAPLTLDPFPGSIGGHVGGTIELAGRYDPAARFVVSLACIESYMSGSGGDRSRRERAEWQDTRLAAAEPGSSGTRLSFRFDVPSNLAESDAGRDGDAYHLWRLNLSAKLPGTDVARDYDIPVYATAESSKRLGERALRTATEEQGRIDEAAVRELVTLSQDASGKRLHYPIGRNVLAATLGVACGGTFAGIGAFIAHGEGAWLFGGVFVMVGALVAVASLYAALNSLEVFREGMTLVSKRRLLGIPVSTKRLHVADVVDLQTSSSFQTQSGGRHVMHYSIHAVGRNGERLVVGEGFRGRGLVDAGRRYIAEQLSLAAFGSGPRSGATTA